MTKAAPHGAAEEGEIDEHKLLGARLRSERVRRNLSVRELARRIGVSASLVSQIETGRVRPSVSSLMALVTELGLSLDNLFSPTPDESVVGEAPHPRDGGGLDVHGAGRHERPAVQPPTASGALASLALTGLLPPTGATTWTKSAGQIAPLLGAWNALGVEHAGSRAFLELESGVRWERLTPHSVPGMEFLYVHYEVGASSTAAGKHTRHQGIEFGYVTSGALHVTVGFDEVVCGTGDSVMFDAETPHRLENRGETPAEAVWLIIGRGSLPVAPHDGH